MARANRSLAEMNPSTSFDKSEWRRRLRTCLSGLSFEHRQAASARARELLRQQEVWQRAKAILLYAPLADELDLGPLAEEALAAGKAVALPRFISDAGTYQPFRISDYKGDCAPGKYGILEPAADCRSMSINVLDLALAPGLGFDEFGRRLGRGRGYYDRLLAGIKGVKCGVAFDEQIVRRLPAQAHDVSMNFILTPTRWLAISDETAVQS